MSESNPAARRKRPDLPARNRSRHPHPIFPLGQEAGIKHCTTCCEDKPFGEFYKDKKNESDGVRGNCKICQRRSSLTSYYADHEANKARIADNRRARLAVMYAELDEIKSAPCVDCGGSFPSVCMDFDHVRGEKVGNISMMIHQVTNWEIVLAEVAKCDVVCSNCHRIRTAQRAGWKRRVI